jgi:DNA-binding IclR family transcriptional regulator
MGMQVLRLAEKMTNGLELRKISHESMAELVEQTEQAAQLAVIENYKRH